MNYLNRLFYIILLVISSLLSIAQHPYEAEYDRSISIQSGVLAESFSPRIAVEYQEYFADNWLWGAAADFALFTSPWVNYDEPQGPLSNPAYFTFNVYRKLPIIGDRWFYQAGLGAGAAMYNGLKPVITASLTMYVRLSPRFYLELPFFIIPAINRYYGSFEIGGGNFYLNDHDLVVIPIGLKFAF